MPKTRSFTTFCDLILLNRLKMVAGVAAVIFAAWAARVFIFSHGPLRPVEATVALLSGIGSAVIYRSATNTKIGARLVGGASLFIVSAGFVNLHLQIVCSLNFDSSEVVALWMVCTSLFVLTVFRFLFAVCLSLIPSVFILFFYRDPQVSEHLLFLAIATAVSVVLNRVARGVLRSQFENRRLLRRALRSTTREGLRIKRMAELSFEAIIEHEEGILKAANRQFTELVGEEEDTLIGRNVCDYFLPGDYQEGWDSLRGEYERAVADGNPPDCAVVSMGLILNKRGEAIPVKVLAGNLKIGETRDEVMVFRDFRPTLSSDQFEKFVTRSAVRSINVPIEQIDTAVEELLEAAGMHTGADRAYLFWFNDDGQTVSNTYEWCASGIEPQKAALQDVPIADIQWWFDRMSEDREIAIPDVETLPDSANAIKEILRAQGIKSLLAIGLFKSGLLTGFVGFDAVREPKSFPQSDAPILRVVAEIALSVLLRAKTESRLTEQDAVFQQLTDNIRDVFYIMSPTMNQVYYLSPAFDSVWGFSRFSVYRDASLLMNSMLPEDREIIASRNQRRRSDPAAVTEATEFRIRRADGSIAWIRIKSSLIKGTQGRVERIAGVAMDVTEDHERKAEAEARVAYETTLGARIQQTLLLGQPPGFIAGVEVGASSAAAQSIGGDFFEFFGGKDYLDIFIGDVMGKGVPAALTSAGIKNTVFRIMGELGPVVSEQQRALPVDIIERASRDLNPDLVELESFVTLSFSRINLKTGLLRFVDCGHVPLIRLAASDGTVDFIKGDDVPLGWDRLDPIHEHWIPVQTGDILLFYSDGITEAASPDEELYGERRLGELLKSLGAADPPTITERIKEDVGRFVSPRTIRDDLTCIALRITEEIRSPEHWARAEFPARYEELPSIRQWVESTLSQFKVGREIQLKVALSVHEAIANDIEHGIALKENDIVALDLRSIDRLLFVMVRDERKFFHDFYFEKNRKRRADRGFGLQIIRDVFDSITYFASSNDSNTLVLALHLGEEIDA